MSCYVTIIDKIVIFCNGVNKTSTSIKLLAINIHVGQGIKSTARLKTFVED